MERDIHNNTEVLPVTKTELWRRNIARAGAAEAFVLMMASGWLPVAPFTWIVPLLASIYEFNQYFDSRAARRKDLTSNHE